MSVAARKLGRWVEARRKTAGLSALALARSAGLSMNVVRNIERGLRRPAWPTLAKLADALHLDDAAKAEFYRIADASNKPRDAVLATAGLPMPGVVTWRHVPELLLSEVPYRIDDDGLVVDHDAIFADIAAAAAALLTFVGTANARLTDAEAEWLVSMARRQFDRWQLRLAGPAGVPRESSRTTAALAAVDVLAVARREQLLAMRDRAARLVKQLSAWTWHYGSFEWPDRERACVSFRFRQLETDARFGFNYIAAPAAARVHDILTSCILWDRLCLDDLLAPLNHETFARDFDIPADGALAVLTGDPQTVFSPWTTGARGGTGDRVLESAAFCLRLFDCPPLAKVILGTGRRELEDRIAILRAMLSERDRKRRSADAVE